MRTLTFQVSKSRSTPRGNIIFCFSFSRERPVCKNTAIRNILSTLKESDPSACNDIRKKHLVRLRGREQSISKQ